MIYSLVISIADNRTACTIFFLEVFLVCDLHATMLQDIDPSRRPGAGPDGYVSLKKHPFFNGVDWDNLRSIPPPNLALEQKVCVSLLFMLFLIFKEILSWLFGLWVQWCGIFFSTL